MDNLRKRYSERETNCAFSLQMIQDTCAGGFEVDELEHGVAGLLPPSCYAL
jgi:hypothetical protein